MFVTALIAAGSTLGPREHLLSEARTLLAENSHVKWVRSALVYETEPVGGPPQGFFLNTVWEVKTDLTSRELMEVLLSVESRLGRKRIERNGPRTVDLDLLFFDDEVRNDTDLVIPHPRLHESWFVLKPLWDLRADWVHPVL